MKILVISALYAPNEIGGAEVTARAIAEGLVLHGHEVVVVSLAPDGRKALREIKGVQCIYIPLANLFWLHGSEQKPAWQRKLWHIIDAYNPIMGRRLGAVLDKEKPDVIHAHNLQGFSVAAWREAKKRKIPVVQTLHDYYFGCANSTMYRNGSNCKTPCMACRIITHPRRLLSPIPHTVTGVSKRVLGRLEERGLFRKTSIKRIIYGCNVDEPQVVAKTDKAPGHDIVIGFFGRIEPIKGLETLLDALNSLNNSSLTLLIGGRGKEFYVDSLKAKYSSSNVRFLGFTKPADFFAQIDILIVPSLWEEPFPRVIHESFSYGVPVIASYLGGMPEIISAETGYLFAAGNSEALATILRNIINSGFKGGLFFSACLKASKNFQPGKILNEYKAALDEAASLFEEEVLKL